MGFWAVAILLYGLNFDPTQYRPWAYDRSSRRYVEIIRAEHGATSQRIVRVGMSWQMEPSFNFYRKALALDWMAPATQDGPNDHYDYYVLLGDDRRLVPSLRLREVARDDVAERTPSWRRRWSLDDQPEGQVPDLLAPEVGDPGQVVREQIAGSLHDVRERVRQCHPTPAFSRGNRCSHPCDTWRTRRRSPGIRSLRARVRFLALPSTNRHSMMADSTICFTTLR